MVKVYNLKCFDRQIHQQTITVIKIMNTYITPHPNSSCPFNPSA